MSGVAGDAVAAAGTNELLGSRQFRGNGGGCNAVAKSKVLLELGRSRRPHRLGWMASTCFGREVGSIKVRAKNPRAHSPPRQQGPPLLARRAIGGRLAELATNL